MSAMLSVVRSVRVLARSPGLSIAVVLMLAVGIGAGTAVFSVLNAVLLAPLRYPDADRLVNVYRFEGASVRYAPVATQDFLDVRDELQGMARIAGHVPVTFTVGGEQGARHLLGAGVTEDFFAVFGLAPLRGRWLDTADEASDSNGARRLGRGAAT